MVNSVLPLALMFAGGSGVVRRAVRVCRWRLGMIVWLNGTFGVGKTTTSGSLAAHSEQVRHFDPEWIGYMLANNLADHAVTDFQQYPSWRRLVPAVADEIITFTGQHLVAAQTILVEDYSTTPASSRCLAYRGGGLACWRMEPVHRLTATSRRASQRQNLPRTLNAVTAEIAPLPAERSGQ